MYLEFDLCDDVTDMLPMATYIGGDLKKLGWAIFKGPNYERECLISALVSGDKHEAKNDWWSPIGDDTNRKYMKCAPKDNLETTKDQEENFETCREFENIIT